MSTPRNHHYVTRSLIDNFMDAQGHIYFYDKAKRICGRKKSSKGLFYETDLNTTITKEGNLDHKSIEDSLNKYFEQDFPKHFSVVKKSVDLAFSEKLEEVNEEEFFNSMKYLTGLGIIGDMRAPEHREEHQKTLIDTFKILYDYFDNNVREQIDELEKKTLITKSAFPPDYKTINDKVLEAMGEIIFTLLIAPDNDYFILPDCSSSVERDYLDNIVEFDGQKLYPPRKISTILMPLSSKILLVAQAKKVCPQRKSGIRPISENHVFKFNKILYNEAYNKIACENKAYLNDLVKKIEHE